MKVKQNDSIENPFHGMRSTLDLYSGQGKNATSDLVRKALGEADTAEKMGVVMSILIGIGDVSGRDPMGLVGVENAGFAQRDVFRDVIIPTVCNVYRDKPVIRQAFAKLVLQYAGAQFLFAGRVKTSTIDKRTKKSTVLKTISMPAVFGVEVVGEVAVEMIRSGGMSRYLALKWINSGTTRKGMRPETVETIRTKRALISYISERMDWKIVATETGGTDYKGFRNAKRSVTGTLESYLFSSGEVLKMDDHEFIKMIGGLPSDARFRVKQRVSKDTEKWSLKGVSMWSLFERWEKEKAEAQKQVRILTEQVTRSASPADEVEIKAKLIAAQKVAKVNFGAKSTDSILSDIFAGKQIDEIAIEAWFNKTKFSQNILQIVDSSGSMSSGNKQRIIAYLITLFMRNQQNDVVRNLLVMFDTTAQVHEGIAIYRKGSGLSDYGTRETVNKPIYDVNLSFMENVEFVYAWLKASARGGATHVNTITDLFIKLYRNDPTIKDVLMQFPVWLMYSDGEFNNERSVAASIGQMLSKFENVFDFRPYVILMDVTNSSGKAREYSGVDGVLYLPPSPENLDAVLSNVNIGSKFDIYTSLQTVSTMKRYEPVRKVFG